MEELEHGEDRLLHTPCGADARQSLIFQVLSRRRGEDDRRVGCGSAVYGNCIFLRALQECTGPNSHFVGRVLSARGTPAKPWLCMRGLVRQLRAARERTFRPPAPWRQPPASLRLVDIPAETAAPVLKVLNAVLKVVLVKRWRYKSGQ